MNLIKVFWNGDVGLVSLYPGKVLMYASGGNGHNDDLYCCDVDGEITIHDRDFEALMSNWSDSSWEDVPRLIRHHKMEEIDPAFEVIHEFPMVGSCGEFSLNLIRFKDIEKVDDNLKRIKYQIVYGHPKKYQIAYEGSVREHHWNSIVANKIGSQLLGTPIGEFVTIAVNVDSDDQSAIEHATSLLTMFIKSGNVLMLPEEDCKRIA